MKRIKKTHRNTISAKIITWFLCKTWLWSEWLSRHSWKPANMSFAQIYVKLQICKGFSNKIWIFTSENLWISYRLPDFRFSNLLQSKIQICFQNKQNVNKVLQDQKFGKTLHFFAKLLKISWNYQVWFGSRFVQT